MYAIAGITGKVGGALARALLADGQPVRAVARAADKGHAWAERGCEVALAQMKDAASLTAAFKGEAELAAVLRRLVEQAGWPGNSNATLAA